VDGTRWARLGRRLAGLYLVQFHVRGWAGYQKI